MKRVLQLIAILMSVVLLVQTPLQVGATIVQNNPASGTSSMDATDDASLVPIVPDDLTSETTPANHDFTDADIDYELVNQREENVKYFKLKDGRRVAAVYNDPVHYQTDSGAWVEYDNTLTASNGVLSAENGDLSVELAQTAGSAGMLTITDGDYTIEWGLLQSQTVITPPIGDVATMSVNSNAALTPTYETNAVNKLATASIQPIELPTERVKLAVNNQATVVYADIFDDIDVEYQLRGNNIKENLILQTADAPSVYTYALSCEGLTAALVDNVVVLSDAKGNVVRRIEAPYMMDNGGNISTDITLSLQTVGGQYRVTMTADADWLETAEYPVTIDPGIMSEPIFSYEYTTVYSYQPTSSSMYDAGYMVVGRHSEDYGMARGVIKFTLPDHFTEADTVTNAQMTLNLAGHGNIDGLLSVRAYPLTQSVTMSSLTWNTLEGKYSTTIEDSHIIHVTNETPPGPFWLDVTKSINTAYNTGQHYGFMLCADTADDRFIVLDTASNQPVLTLTYVTHDGLESHLSYHSFGSSTMGVAQVADYSGNLLYQYSDVVAGGSMLPVAVTHIYDHAKRTQKSPTGHTSAFVGYGMTLNLFQRIIPLDPEDDRYYRGYYYLYVDADGTTHHFGGSNAPGTYVMEDNELLILEIINESSDRYYRLYDGGQTMYIFNQSGYLTYIHDVAADTAAVVGYDSAGRAIKFYNGSGAEITLTYNADGYLTSIKDPANRATTYEYTGGYLTKITRPDGKTVQFGYTAEGSYKRLISITDIDGSSLYIGYTATTLPVNAPSVRRVSEVTQLGSAGGLGQRAFFAYSPGQTKITDEYPITEDAYTKAEFMIFDHQGRTVSVRDKHGNAVYGAYNDEGNKKDTLKYESKMQSSVTNLLLNSGFESGVLSPWVNYTNSTGGTGTASIANTAYEGTGALCIERTNGNGRFAYMQYLEVDDLAGKSLTFSGYVKVAALQTDATASSSGVLITYSYKNTAGTWKLGRREFIKTTTNGWNRVCHTFTFPEDVVSSSVRICLGLENATGTVYFDKTQVEYGDVMNRVNLLNNGHFRESAGTGVPAHWSGANLSSTADKTVSGGMTGSGYQMTGNRSALKSLSQTVAIDPDVARVGMNFVVNAWVKAGHSIATTDPSDGYARPAGIRLTMTYTDGTSDEVYLNAEPYAPDWQYLSGSIRANEKVPANIQVALVYGYQENTILFDDIQLYQENYSVDYAYDDYGRMTSTTDIMGQVTTYEYLGLTPLVTKVAYPDGTSEEHTYNPSTTRLLSSTDRKGNTTTYTYDDFGNMEGSSTTSSASSLTVPSVLTEYAGPYPYSTTDPYGNTSTMVYDYNKGLLTSVTDPTGVTTEYSYNEHNDAVTAIEAESSGAQAKVTYEYDNTGRLFLLSRTSTGNNTEYRFTYDEFGNTDTVWVGSYQLTDNAYEPQNGNLLSSTYGNGDSVSYAYDDLDRVTEKAYNGTTKYTWSYASNGLIGLHKDLENDVTWRYEYNNQNQVTHVFADDGTDYAYTYDEYDRLVTVEGTNHGTDWYVGYSYTATDLPRTVYYETGGGEEYIYDNFDRLIQVKTDTDVVITDIEYRPGSAANTTTGMISKYTVSGNGWSHVYEYTYDSRGNIATIKKNGAEIVSYLYDEQNQLLYENNAIENKAYYYPYSGNGNLACRVVYPYGITYEQSMEMGALSSDTYMYENTAWPDQLTGYGEDGATEIQTITYDSIGNPLSYRGWTFDWQGRQLQSAVKGTTSLSYKYDADGIRVSKTLNGTTTTYAYEGGKLRAQKTGSEIVWFQYGADDVLMSITVDNSTYYYVTNWQGDVIGLTDASGNLVVEYTYDVWGKLLTTTGSLATTIGVTNPFRYRGYYYDTETGFYYLQSRYYDPVIRRFINSDTIDVIVATPATLTDKNLYAYCDSNPVMRIDRGGQFWDTVFDVVSLVASVVEVCANPSDPLTWVGVVGDVVDLIPFVTGVGEVTRLARITNNTLEVIDTAHDTGKVLSNADEAVEAGWKLGDDITKATKAGNDPSWSTVRSRYWKNEALYNKAAYSDPNLQIMRKGKAPKIEYKGKHYSAELHHIVPQRVGGSNAYSNLLPVTPLEHASIDPYRRFG